MRVRERVSVNSRVVTGTVDGADDDANEAGVGGEAMRIPALTPPAPAMRATNAVRASQRREDAISTPEGGCGHLLGSSTHRCQMSGPWDGSMKGSALSRGVPLSRARASSWAVKDGSTALLRIKHCVYSSLKSR